MKFIQPALLFLIIAAAAVLATRILATAPPAPAEAHGHEESSGHEEHRHVELSDVDAAAAGIEVETAGPATLRTALSLSGRIRANEDETAHAMPRYPGIVKTVGKRLGESVRKGDVLAVVESNESLQPYEIKAEIAGTITARDVTPGEFVDGRNPLFTITNLETVRVDLDVHRRDLPSLRVGQSLVLDGGPGVGTSEAVIDHLSPFGAENSQTVIARATIPNPGGRWRPGLLVRGEVLVGEAAVPVAVKSAAVQTLEGSEVVFVREGDEFEAVPVVTGRRDGERVEIKSGLEAGTRHAAGNSYVLKADLGKSGAGHDH